MAGQVNGTQAPDDSIGPAEELDDLKERCRLLEEENGRLRRRLNDPGWLRQRLIALFGGARGPSLGFALGIAVWATVAAMTPIDDEAFRRLERGQPPNLVVQPRPGHPVVQVPARPALPPRITAAANPATPEPSQAPVSEPVAAPTPTAEAPVLPVPVSTPSLPLPPLPVATPSAPLPLP